MRRLVLLANVLFSAIGFLSIFLALAAFMLFDAPGSENNTYLWIVFWASLALPFACFGAVIMSMRVFNTGNYKKALFILLIPCAVIAILCGGLGMIRIYCGGNFSCGY